MKSQLSKILWLAAALSCGILPEGSIGCLYAEEINETVTGQITGNVLNEKGETLPGVAITVKGTAVGTTTDMDGRFSIQIDPGQDVLIFSYLGYQPVERKVTRRMRIVMKEDVQVLGEVVVTTQKRAQTSIEVPTSVSALNGNTLKRLNLKQFDEVAQYIPGLQIQMQSPNNPGYVIRGVTSDDGASYSQPRVSIFQDGVSISRSRASAVELFDLERVEVVKGPQGTLFGRGAEIGAVHVIRNKPINYLSGEIAVNYGTHNQRAVSGFINTPLIKDKLANRFAFSYDAHDGFIDNLSGGKLNGKSAIAVRNSTRMFFGEHTTADLVFDYQHDNYPGTSFKSRKYAPLGGNTDPNSFADLEQGDNLFIKRHVGGAAFLLDHQFNDYWKLSSITGFRAFKSEENFDADGTCSPILFATEKEQGTQFSQEFRINYDSKGRFSGFAGISYFYENSRQEVITRTNEQALYPAYAAAKMKKTFSEMLKDVPATMQPMVDGLMGAIFPDMQAVQDGKAQYVTNLPNIRKIIEAAVSQQLGSPMTLEQIVGTLMAGKTVQEQAQVIGMIDAYSNKALATNYEESSTNYGINQAAEIFADGTLKIVKGLSLTAGIRATYEHQKSGYQSPTVPGTFGVMLYYPSTDKYWASDSYGSWVGRAALNYLFNKNNAYISVSRGRRPGVIAVTSGKQGEMEVNKLQPEIITSYEAGLKGIVLGGKLNYDLSVYYYDWNHFQTTTLKDNGALGLETVPDDAGRAHTFGVEAGVQYAPCRHLTLFGNYSYIDGKFNGTDENGVPQEYAGNRFRLTPKNTFSAGVDVNIPTGKTGNVYIRPSYSYKSQVFFEDNNREDLSQEGYGIANFTAGYRFHPKNVYYEIGVFGKNAFNKKYIIDAGNSGDNIGMPTYVAGSPSVFGVQLKVGF
ncbi:TonB-dependent receptor [Bacteroides sp. 3_1_13]|uniref:TonB-dependent receptor n=1 Tax=Bacteroides sp. 3_1_13 TaxID=457389 RepID=UPI00067209DD|nr:TonB-dependent receptor [Bacteroides sp. 3_1_13]KMW80013.1 hypothetical protein HMPREF9009_00735 [Bacteroides sp. 3_1_13]